MVPKLLVIGGVMRGGTSLLRDIIGTHPAIAVFSSELLALIWCGQPILPHLARVQHHLLLENRWLRYPEYPREVYRYLWHLAWGNGLFRGPVTVEMCHRAFAAALAKPGCIYVGDKYPDYVFHCQHFLHQPDCRVILIVRDPRDTVASILFRIRKGNWAGKRWVRQYSTVAGASRYWNEAAAVMANMNRQQSGALVIRYEDLVTATHSTIGRIARYLEVDAGGFVSGSAHGHSVGNHVHHLETGEAREVERETATLMAAFGYRDIAT